MCVCECVSVCVFVCVCVCARARARAFVPESALVSVFGGGGIWGARTHTFFLFFFCSLFISVQQSLYFRFCSLCVCFWQVHKTALN